MYWEAKGESKGREREARNEQRMGAEKMRESADEKGGESSWVWRAGRERKERESALVARRETHRETMEDSLRRRSKGS